MVKAVKFNVNVLSDHDTTKGDYFIGTAHFRHIYPRLWF